MTQYVPLSKNERKTFSEEDIPTTSRCVTIAVFQWRAIILPPAKPVFARSLTKIKESEENEKQENGEDDDDEDALSLEEIRKLIVKIPGCTEVSAEDVGEWMVCDTSDPGFQIINDDEIVESVRDVEVEVEEELSADVEVDGGPSASEAFAGLETWLPENG
nr:unnamed protein product [Callosobruchus chinensis]